MDEQKTEIVSYLENASLFLMGLLLLIFPFFLFTFCVLLSSVFAVNRADALISFVPFLFSILAFFAIVNTAKDRNSALLLVTSLLTGACIVSILSLLSFLKIYILPFSFAKFQTFNPFGSLLDQALYLLFVLPLSVYLAWPLLSKRKSDDSSVVTLESSGNEKKGNLVPFA